MTTTGRVLSPARFVRRSARRAAAPRFVHVFVWTICVATMIPMPAAADQRRVVDLDVQVEDTGEDALRVPSRLVVTPSMGKGPLRGMAVGVETEATVRYSTGYQWLTVAPITVAATQPLIDGDGSLTFFSARTTLEGTGGIQHASDVVTWFGGEAFDLWMRAGSAGGDTGPVSPTVAAIVSHTLHPRLATFADVAYATAMSESSLRVSHGVVYHPAAGRSLDLTCRHGSAATSACTLTFAVTLGR